MVPSLSLIIYLYFTWRVSPGSPPERYSSYRQGFILIHYHSLSSSKLHSHILVPIVIPTLDLSALHIYHPPFSPTLHIQTNSKTLYTTFYGLYYGVIFLVIPHLYALLYDHTSSIYILHRLQQQMTQSYNIFGNLLNLINYGDPSSIHILDRK